MEKNERMGREPVLQWEMALWWDFPQFSGKSRRQMSEEWLWFEVLGFLVDREQYFSFFAF